MKKGKLTTLAILGITTGLLVTGIDQNPIDASPQMAPIAANSGCNSSVRQVNYQQNPYYQADDYDYEPAAYQQSNRNSNNPSRYSNPSYQSSTSNLGNPSQFQGSYGNPSQFQGSYGNPSQFQGSYGNPFSSQSNRGPSGSFYPSPSTPANLGGSSSQSNPYGIGGFGQQASSPFAQQPLGGIGQQTTQPLSSPFGQQSSSPFARQPSGGIGQQTAQPLSNPFGQLPAGPTPSPFSQPQSMIQAAPPVGLPPTIQSTPGPSPLPGGAGIQGY